MIKVTTVGYELIAFQNGYAITERPPNVLMLLGTAGHCIIKLSMADEDVMTQDNGPLIYLLGSNNLLC